MRECSEVIDMWVFVKDSENMYSVGHWKNGNIFVRLIAVRDVADAIMLIHYLNGGDLDGRVLERILEDE